jgi:hypothetical protein
LDVLDDKDKFLLVKFRRLQNWSIFCLFLKCGSKYFIRSFDKDGHSNR